MKIAHWIEWGELEREELPEGRVYLGTESCERLIPSSDVLLRAAGFLSESGRELSLVLPFASERAFRRAEALLDPLCAAYPGTEVVCNDWGLLASVAQRAGLVPVVGRLLVRQRTDPRLATLCDAAYQEAAEREVMHADGTLARLRYRAPGTRLRESLKGTALGDPGFIDFLKGYRVGRAEMNNALQGIPALSPGSLRLSLHVPDLLVTISRDCGEFPESRPSLCDCSGLAFAGPPSIRRYPGLPVPLYRWGNALFALNEKIPDEGAAGNIDRIILRKAFTGRA